MRAINASAAFNAWLGLEVAAAAPGEVELRLGSRPDFGQYAGFLHAGIIGGLIDTACGFAAATVAGRVLASHYSVNCLTPAVGEAFVVRGRVLRAGRRQIFAQAELFGLRGGVEKLAATGETILMPAE
ncbi:MAG: PaaI family thioesterase [Pseudomonadota bacterium]|nr:PaaI family thioesterase [Pseudomonadota bacterium]